MKLTMKAIATNSRKKRILRNCFYITKAWLEIKDRVLKNYHPTFAVRIQQIVKGGNFRVIYRVTDNKKMVHLHLCVASQ